MADFPLASASLQRCLPPQCTIFLTSFPRLPGYLLPQGISSLGHLPLHSISILLPQGICLPITHDISLQREFPSSGSLPPNGISYPEYLPPQGIPFHAISLPGPGISLPMVSPLPGYLLSREFPFPGYLPPHDIFFPLDIFFPKVFALPRYLLSQAFSATLGRP